MDVRRFPWIRRLAADVAFDFSSVAPFFAGNPADPSAWTAAIARTRAQPRAGTGIATVLAAQQARRGAPAAAVAAAQQLANPDTVAIVTGQQAGLFGGPLFTLLKAITALKLAAQVSREHRVPAVAVFWVEAEDHDWNEVRACTALDEAVAPRSVALPADARPEPAPVAAVQLDASVTAAIDELESALPATEFRASTLEALRAAYTPGRGMADAFSRWIERVAGDRGLIVYDASDPAAKPLAAPVFTREVETAGATTSLSAAAGADLVARGYHAQVQMPDDGVALFQLNGARRPIRREGSGFAVDGDAIAAGALAQQARERPERFSPNVLLRPIVQDTLFPTLCYVAGPNELAYLAQLRGVYEHFGVPMPLMYPRASATIVDSAALRFLQKYDLPIESLQAQDEAALNELLNRQIPPVVEDTFEAAGRAVDTSMAALIGAMPALDPTLEGAARSTLGRMQHDLQTLHGKMIQAAKRRDETLRRQFARTRSLVFPNGHPQEREISFISFLNQYGPALLDRLTEELPLEPGQHWVIAI